MVRIFTKTDCADSKRLEPVDTEFLASENTRGLVPRTAVQSGFEDYTASEFLAAEFLVFNLMKGTETIFVGCSEDSLRFFEKAMDYGWKGNYCHCTPQNLTEDQDNGIIIQHIFKDWLSGETVIGPLMGGTRFWRCLQSSQSKLILDVQLTPPRIDSYPCFRCSEKDGDFLYVSRFEGQRLQRLERLDTSLKATFHNRVFNQPLNAYNFPKPSLLRHEETVGMWDMTATWKISQSGSEMISQGHCILRAIATEDVIFDEVTNANDPAKTQDNSTFPRYVVDYYGRQLLSADGVVTHYAAASDASRTYGLSVNLGTKQNVDDNDQCRVVSHSDCAKIAFEVFVPILYQNNPTYLRDGNATSGNSALGFCVGRKNVASVVVLDGELFCRSEAVVEVRVSRNTNETIRSYINQTILPLLKTHYGHTYQTQSVSASDQSLAPDYHMGLHKLCRSKRILARYSPLAIQDSSTLFYQTVFISLLVLVDVAINMFFGILGIFSFAFLVGAGNLSERAILLNAEFEESLTWKFLVVFIFVYVPPIYILTKPGLPYMLFGWEGGTNELRNDPDQPGTSRWFPVKDELTLLTPFIILLYAPVLFTAFVVAIIKSYKIPAYMYKVHDDYNAIQLFFFVLLFLIAFGNFLNETYQSPILTSAYISLSFSGMEAGFIIFIEKVLSRLWFDEFCKFEKEIDQTRGLGALTQSNHSNNTVNVSSEETHTVAPTSIITNFSNKHHCQLAPFDNLNPYPCGIDRLCDKIKSQTNRSLLLGRSDSISSSDSEIASKVYNARRDQWAGVRKRIEDQKKGAGKKVQDEEQQKSRLTIQAELNLLESSIGHFFIFHSIFIHATFEVGRLIVLISNAKNLPKGSMSSVFSIMISSIINVVNRIGIPRLLIVAFLPESDTKLGSINKVFFTPTVINKIHDTAKFGAGYCRFAFISAIFVFRAVYLDRDFDPYNKRNYLTTYEDSSDLFSNIIAKDRLDPTQVRYDSFCWNGNCLNVVLAALFFEIVEDALVNLFHNNKRLKRLSASIMGYAYDLHLVKWHKQLPYNQFDKLHHHRLYVKNTEGSINIVNSSQPEVNTTSSFDSFVNILESIISRSKFGREAVALQGQYVPSPRCRHLRKFGTIRGGSLQIDLFSHALGPLIIQGIACFPALTMGNHEFHGDRPTFSTSGSFKAQEVFLYISRLHDNIIK